MGRERVRKDPEPAAKFLLRHLAVRIFAQASCLLQNPLPVSTWLKKPRRLRPGHICATASPRLMGRVAPESSDRAPPTITKGPFMKRSASITLSALLLICTPAFANDNEKEKESRCKQALEGAIKILRDSPTNNERDRADKAKLEDRIDKMLAEKRAATATQCEMWMELNQIAVRF